MQIEEAFLFQTLIKPLLRPPLEIMASVQSQKSTNYVFQISFASLRFLSSLVIARGCFLSFAANTVSALIPGKKWEKQDASCSGEKKEAGV